MGAITKKIKKKEGNRLLSTLLFVLKMYTVPSLWFVFMNKVLQKKEESMMKKNVKFLNIGMLSLIIVSVIAAWMVFAWTVLSVETFNEGLVIKAFLATFLLIVSCMITTGSFVFLTEEI